MAGKILHAGVVGASTLLGKELLEEISGSAAAAWDLKLLEEGDDIEGQLTSAGDEALVMHTLDEAAFTGLDLVFFASSPTITRTFLKASLKAGSAIVDLSGATESEPGFLVRSPWLESSQRPDLTTNGVTVPQPASLMLATIAERLQRRFGHVDLVATLLEPASQAGTAGVDELHQQTVSLLSFQDLPKTVFGTQIAFNVQGTLGEESQVSLATSRARIQADLGRLLGASFDGAISLQLLQVPVFHGYVASAHIRLASPATVNAVRSILGGGVVVAAEDTLPSNQAATESGDLLVSVHADEGNDEAFWLLFAADNLRLMARSAVQSALEMAAWRPGTHVQ